MLTQPADIANGPASFSALVALGGFLLGAVLLIVAVLPVLPTSTLVLIPVALVLNMVLGQLMGSTGLPFYLDAIGTVLIAVLAGPRGRRRHRRAEQHRLVLLQPDRPALRCRRRTDRLPGRAGRPLAGCSAASTWPR